MNKNTVATLDRLSDQALDLARDLVTAFQDAEIASAQPLTAEGTDQALEAFMDEREDLKIANDLSELTIASRDLEIANLRRSHDQVSAVLQHIAAFNTALQGQLNALGIRFQAGADGSPDVFIDAEHLTGFLVDQQAA